MNRITSIALIFLMSIQCFYKLGVITYFQLNRDYIAEVLCINKEEPITMCYGKCFLNKNLALADDASANQATPVGKQQIDFPVFLISEEAACQLTTETASTDLNSPYIKGSSSEHSSAPFHPPALVI